MFSIYYLLVHIFICALISSFVKYERARILRAPLINNTLALAFRSNFAAFSQPFQQAGRLKWTNPAEFCCFRPFDGTVLVNIGQNHLLLLYGIESGLSDIGGFLTGMPIHLGAKGVSSAPSCSVGFNKACFHQLFERGVRTSGCVRSDLRLSDVAHDAEGKG